MRPFSAAITIAGIAASLALVPTPANAQAPGNGGPILHVNNAHKSWSFELHPELTQDQFKEFAGELGSILRFRQLGDARTIGKGAFEVSLQYTSNPVDGSKGAWNNTMSHPTATHYLGRSIAFPRLVARFGVSDHVDLGAWGTFKPNSNHAIVGIDSNIALLRQARRMPVSVSIRPSLSVLFGPSDFWAGSGSIDVSVSRAFGPVSPYVGFVTSGSLAVEQSAAVDLRPAVADESSSYAGLSLCWRKLVIAAEVQKGHRVSYGLRIGTRF